MRVKSKSASASTRTETSVAPTRSKITKKPRKKSPARGEETSEEATIPTIPSPRIKMKFNKKFKTWSVNASTGPKTSITSSKSKIVAKLHKTTNNNTLRDFDVLLGRGKFVASWIGNKNFRSIVFSYKAAYKNANKQEKQFFSRQVIEDVHEGGGRFVENNVSSGYVEVSHKKALEKTSQCLREKLAAGSVHVLPEKYSEIIPEEESPKLGKPSTSFTKRKGVCSPSRPSKIVKKARTEEATKILPPLTASVITIKKNAQKKDFPVRKISLKKKPDKKEPRLPRKVVTKSTNNNVAASATKVCPTSSGIITTAKSTESEDEQCRVQKLVDQAFEINTMRSHPGDLDDMFGLMPPNLTVFLSGIVSLSERSIHAVIGKGHPGADLLTGTPSSTPTRGKSLAGLKQARDKIARDTNLESPTNVTDFDRVMLEAIFEPAFEPRQSSDFAMDLLEDSSAPHWPSHGYIG